MKITRELPQRLNNGAIERAVREFIADSTTLGNPEGIYRQTVERIASFTFLGGPGDFWLAEEDGEVIAYTLAHVSKEVDNKLCYYVTQSYVCKKLRGDAVVKDWWNLFKKRAKQLLCDRIIIVSSRNPEAYSRFLGNGLKPYATLMMEDLED